MGRLFSIALVCMLAATTCVAAPPQAFAPEVYQSKDGKESITLVSKDKAERFANDQTTTGTYTRTKDELHVTLSAQGVSFTTVYRITKQGLVSQQSQVLLRKRSSMGMREVDPQFAQEFPHSPPSPEEHVSVEGGRLVVELTVDDKGMISRTKLLESSGSPEMDKHIQDWIKKRWRFPKGKPLTTNRPSTSN